MMLLIASSWSHSLVIFVISLTLAGAAYSLLFQGGLALVNANAPAEHRARLLSAVYLIAYVTMGAVALLLGVAATHWGLAHAIPYGSPVVGGVALLACALMLFSERRTTPRRLARA